MCPVRAELEGWLLFEVASSTLCSQQGVLRAQRDAGPLKGNTLEPNGCFDQESIVAFMSEPLIVPPETVPRSSASERIVFFSAV